MERSLAGFSEAGHLEAMSFAAISAFVALFVAMALKSSMTSHPRGNERMNSLGDSVQKGSKSFMAKQQKFLLPLLLAIYITLVVLYSIESPSTDYTDGLRIGGCFVAGAILSAIATYAGVSVAADANVRVAQALNDGNEGTGTGTGKALYVAITAGSVVSFTVSGLCLGGIAILYYIMTVGRPDDSIAEQSIFALEALVGFGLGASSVAVFTRFAGGIFAKGSELSATMLSNENENPAWIAEKVGENISGIAGTGAEYFESLAASIIAAAILAGGDIVLISLSFWVAAAGIISSMVGFFFIRAAANGSSKNDLLYALYKGKMITSTLLIVISIAIVMVFFESAGEGYTAVSCVIIGQFYGLLIGHATEYFTSHNFAVESLNKAGALSASMYMIKAFGIGALSVLIPAVIIVATALACLYLAGLYGVAIAAVSVISTLSTNLACDAFASISKNAVSIVAEAGEGDNAESVGVLDGTASAVAATGRGFAMGSSVITSISLLLAFEATVGIAVLNINSPTVIGGLLVGATLPYVFAALVFLSCQKAAEAILVDAQKQLDSDSITTDGCVNAANVVSHQEMILPCLYVSMSPLIVGILVGPQALAAMLVGSIASGFLLGSTLSNTGSALTHASKYTKLGSTSVGSTVGCVMNGAVGTALATLIKLMAIVSLTVSPLMGAWTEWGQWYFGFIPFGVCVVGTVVVAISFWMNVEEPTPTAATEEA
uniref:H(+)-exporting diphosphatase n=2 Tax=Chaetoceros debilis TaxID=122233 RepID=A0A6S8YMB2_9STRA|mmetsp:Transcript_20686/g.31403  ORF Transcript_20686/g.31403 Transcript_20686/m.31403 type:complete len:719 (+) Transcript_20686:151-2307(+)